MQMAYWPAIAGEEVAARLRAIPGVDLTVVESFEALENAAPRMEALVIGGHFFDARTAELLRTRARRLRFIQCYTAGYEGLQAHGVPAGVVVANAASAWAPGVAEHTIALLLALVKRLPHWIAAQSQRAWKREAAARMASLEGMTAAVVGFGGIGREFARRARPFGMRVIGLARSGRQDRLAEEVRPMTELSRVLAVADAIVLALPYSPATHHLIGAAQLAACRPGAFLVNVARGGLVDSPALAAALASGRLAGAALDVTEPEPLPPGDPLWSAPNLLVTPHVAGSAGPVFRARLAETIGANIARFAAGETPEHVIQL